MAPFLKSSSDLPSDSEFEAAFTVSLSLSPESFPQVVDGVLYGGILDVRVQQLAVERVGDLHGRVHAAVALQDANFQRIN